MVVDWFYWLILLILLGGKNSVQGPLLLELLLALKQCLQLFTNKEAHWLSFYNVLLSLLNKVFM